MRIMTITLQSEDIRNLLMQTVLVRLQEDGRDKNTLDLCKVSF